MNRGRIVGSFSYLFCIRSHDIWFPSPLFRIKKLNNCNFQIRVCEKREPHSLQVSLKKSNKKSNSAKIIVSFLQKKITRIVDDWVDTCLLTNEILESPVEHIEISCEIIWYDTKTDSTPIQAPLNLFSDLKNFHLNPSMSDLQISISGKELPAHKFILAAHSPVFLNMFETDMKEERENRIVIEGIELDVMKVVLSILYGGDDNDLNGVEMAMKVLIVAERYAMKTLKTFCEWKLSQKLEVSNVLEILEEADTCNAEALRETCMSFIVENKKQMPGAESLTAICRRKPEVVSELLKIFMDIP